MIKILLGSGLLMGLFACTDSEPPVYPDIDSKGAQLMLNWCKDCHIPPQPSTHQQGEWAAVVYRMERHRVVRNLPLMPKVDKEQIVSYLERYASSTP